MFPHLKPKPDFDHALNPNMELNPYQHLDQDQVPDQDLLANFGPVNDPINPQASCPDRSHELSPDRDQGFLCEIFFFIIKFVGGNFTHPSSISVL